MLDRQLFIHENTGTFFELIGIFGGDVMYASAGSALVFDVGMTFQVPLQTIGDIGSLCHNADTLRHISQDFWQENGIVGAT